MTYPRKHYENPFYRTYSKGIRRIKTCLSSEFTVKILQLTFYNHLKSNVDFEIIQKRYDPEKFPGIFLKVKKCSALVFSSGKAVIIGASSKEDAKQGIFFFLNY